MQNQLQRCFYPQPLHERHGRMNLWNDRAAALLAGTDGDLAPMSKALVGPLVFQSDFTAFADNRRDFRNTQFDGFLDRPVHPFATRKALAEVNPQARLGQPRLLLVELDTDQ